MTLTEAVEFVRPGITPGVNECWADLGAGTGTFTRALAHLLGKDGRVLAVERDRRALNELRRISQEITSPQVDIAAGDITDLTTISLIKNVQLDGALLANVLHFIADPVAVLRDLRALLRPAGTVLVIEYERRNASRWVPYPLPLSRLASVAKEAGFGEPVEVNRRASRYQGTMYCARLVRE